MIRPYKETDRHTLLNIFRLNTPKFFDPSEENDFKEYLNLHSDNYFVVEYKSEILGSGGYHFLNDHKLARISWGLFHPNSQGKGYGKKLTLFRIEQIKKDIRVRTINVKTSQVAYKFYEKLGFVLSEITKDFWAKGLHLYDMEIKIT